MSKRKLEEESDPVETKRHKTEQQDTRKASLRALMNKNIVGSILAPFLLTEDLNSLMRACKTLVAHLNTNPEAWSPALFINQTGFLPLFYKQDQEQKNFLSKISPTKLRKVVIDMTNASGRSMDNLHIWTTVLAVTMKQRPLDELVLIDFNGDTDLSIKGWHLYARATTPINVTFGRHEGDMSDYKLPSVIEEWNCTLHTVHLHARILSANNNIRRLKLDASFADEDEEECTLCNDEMPSGFCFPYQFHGIETLEIQLGRIASAERQSGRWGLGMATSSMPNLKKLALHGTTDRPQTWLKEDIAAIRSDHRNGSTMQIDVSNLQVPEVFVVPKHVPFVLPPLK